MDLAGPAHLPYKRVSMNSTFKLSYEMLSFLKLVFMFLILSFVFRCVFYFMFKSTADADYSAQELRKAFFIGAKFDLRASIFLSLPFWIFGYSIKFINFSVKEKNRMMFSPETQSATVWVQIFYSLLTSVYSLFLFADFKHYETYKIRTDSLYFSYQSLFSFYYLFILILLSLVFFFVLQQFVLKEKVFKSNSGVLTNPIQLNIAIFFVVATLAHAKFSLHALEKKDALFSKNAFISAMGLNPVLYLSFKKN